MYSYHHIIYHIVLCNYDFMEKLCNAYVGVDLLHIIQIANETLVSNSQLFQLNRVRQLREIKKVAFIHV